ncbi:MAG: hypothetical protein AAGE94_09090 [Acidobacteriota bacterium]
MTFMQLLDALHQQHGRPTAGDRQALVPTSALFLNVDVVRPEAANDDEPFLPDLHRSLG